MQYTTNNQTDSQIDSMGQSQLKGQVYENRKTCIGPRKK